MFEIHSAYLNISNNLQIASSSIESSPEIITMSSKGNLLTPQEVADELQLNLLTIYRYIKSKKILAIRLGRTYRIQKNDLEAFIESNKTY